MSSRLNMEAVKDRLRTQITEDQIPVIEQAADLASALERPLASVSAYLIPAENTVTGPQGNGLGRIMTSTFGVVVILSTYDEEPADELSTYLQLIEDALERWTPDGAPGDRWSPMLYQGGNLIYIDTGVIGWQDNYATQKNR